MRFYNLTDYQLKQMVSNLKCKHIGDKNLHKIVDANRMPDDKILQEMMEEAKSYGFQLTEEAAGLLKLSQGERPETA